MFHYIGVLPSNINRAPIFHYFQATKFRFSIPLQVFSLKKIANTRLTLKHFLNIGLIRHLDITLRSFFLSTFSSIISYNVLEKLTKIR